MPNSPRSIAEITGSISDPTGVADQDVFTREGHTCHGQEQEVTFCIQSQQLPNYAPGFARRSAPGTFATLS